MMIWLFSFFFEWLSLRKWT